MGLFFNRNRKKVDEERSAVREEFVELVELRKAAFLMGHAFNLDNPKKFGDALGKAAAQLQDALKHDKRFASIAEDLQKRFGTDPLIISSLNQAKRAFNLIAKILDDVSALSAVYAVTKRPIAPASRQRLRNLTEELFALIRGLEAALKKIK